MKPVARDIASLTRACIAKTPIKPTAEMYQRVAFIVSQVIPLSFRSLIALSASLCGQVCEVGQDGRGLLAGRGQQAYQVPEGVGRQGSGTVVSYFQGL